MDAIFLRRLTRIYLTLPVIGGIALVLTQAGPALFTSPRNLLSISIFAIFIFGLLILTGLAWFAWRDPQRAERWARWTSGPLHKDFIYWSVVTLAGLGSILGLYLLPLSLQVTRAPFEMHPIYVLSPYLPWLILVGLETLVAVRLLRHSTRVQGFEAYGGLFRAFGVTAVILLLLGLAVRITGIGLHPDPVDWGVPGVPLLASQVALAVGLAMAFFLAGKLVVRLWKKLRRQDEFSPGWKTDALICILLWGSAVWLWGSQPLKASWFNPNPRPPNMEIYPYSDSIHYDLSAQRLLLGQGFEEDVIRPVYSGFLALAQAVSGIDYDSVVNWQVAVLAVIPALLYLLGKTLHHRLSGILVGTLAILHESNALTLTGLTDVSTSKMYMSDFPAQMGMILFALFVVSWLKTPHSKRLYPFLTGGSLGIFMLVRTQILLVLPVLPFLAFLAYRRQPSRWLQGSLLLIAGLTISLLPWTVRNWTTARSVLSDPEPGGVIFRYDTFAPEAMERLPGEAEEVYVARARSTITEAVLARPVETFHVIAGHYVNNHIASLFVLPSSYLAPQMGQFSEYAPSSGLFWLDYWNACCRAEGYVSRVSFWSGTWDMDFPPETWLPLLSGVALFGLGIAAAWKHAYMAAAAPLLMGVLYNVGNAGARLSGWRFNLPVDWVAMLFYAIGLVQVLFWLGTLFGNRLVPGDWREWSEEAAPVGVGNRRRLWPQALAAGVFFFLFTATLPIAERTIPDHFEGVTIETVIASLEESGALAQIDTRAIESFMAEEGAVAAVGRAFYPRHYWANQGEISRRWPVYETREFARLGFMLAPQKYQVMLPGSRPKLFPNAADVLVLGCQRGEIVEAYVVAVLEQPQEILVSSEFEKLACSAR